MIFVNALLGNIIIWLFLVLLIFIISKFKKILLKYIEYITALTVWLLIWIVFLWFIPEVIEEWLQPDLMWLLIIAWLVWFYWLELLLHHHHCKDLWNDSAKHQHEHNNLMRFGTLIHNMLHWLVLYSAFSVSKEFGISVTIAVLLHSIPQNTANYIMNHNNMKIVLLAAVWWVIWVLLLFPFTNILLEYELQVLSIIGWWLLYIALTDILPHVKNQWNNLTKLIYYLFVILWIGIMYII